MKIIVRVLLLFIITTTLTFAQNATTQFRQFVNEKDYEKAGEVAAKALEESPKDIQLAIAIGDVYTELEDYDNALKAYSKAHSIDEKDINAAIKWANALSNLKRGKEAIEEISKLTSKNKKNANLMIALANAYLSMGDTKNAEQQITNARSIDGKNPEVFNMLGNIYFEQKIWELAKMNYEDAIKYDSNNVLARQRLAEVYWKLAVQADGGGDVELMNEYLNRSLDQCNMLVQNDPKDANSWRLKGQIHFNANQNLEAAQSYNKFLELRPNNTNERFRLATLLATHGMCDSAIRHLQILNNTKANNTQDSTRLAIVKFHLGNCLYAMKQYEAASDVTLNYIRMMEEQVALDSSVAKEIPSIVYLTLALSTLMATDTTKAFGYFNTLFEKFPNENCNVMLLVGARLYYSKKMYGDAIRTLTQYVTNCPQTDEFPYAYYIMGISNFELKNTDAAITALNKAIEINPDYYFAHIYLGDILVGQKKQAEGEAEFNFVIEKAKSDPVKYKNELNMAFQKFAGIRLDAKKYTDLNKICKQWLEILPENNELGNLYLAVSYQGNGDKDNACRSYHEVLKINKDNKTAKDNLKALGC